MSPAARSLALLAAAIASWSAAAPPAAASTWQRPVPGAVVARFSYARAHRFEAGQRRGIDLVAAAGEPVAAPCPGVVAYAGRVPGHRLGVSLQCGRLTATVLGLESLQVHSGDPLVTGRTLGAAAGPAVRLGARRTADRWGYVDPVRLLGTSATPPPPVVLPRVGPRDSAAPPVAVSVPAHRTAPASAPVAPGAPTLAWAGLVAVAVALPGGGLVARRRCRSSRAAVPAARWAAQARR